MAINRALLAHLAAAVAALGGGSAVVATRLAVGESDPVSLAFYRYVIAAACMLPVLALAWPRGGLRAADWGAMALLGALFFGLFPWSFSAALEITTAPRGAIGLATVPVQTLLVAVLVGRERLSRAKLASVGLAVAGIAVVFGPEAWRSGGAATWRGDAMMLFAAFCAAVYSVYSRPVLQRLGPLFATALGMQFGLLALAPPAALTGALSAWPDFSSAGWLAVIFLGTLSGAIQFALYTWALRWLDPSRVAIYLALNPLAAVALGALLLGETAGPVLLVGLALVLLAIAAAARPAAPARARRTS